MEGWKIRELGELATVGAGNSAPQNDALFADGTVPFFRTSDVGRIRFGNIDTAADYLNERGTRGLRRLPKGTILFPKSGASTFLNHRVMMQVEGCVSSHLATITSHWELAEPRFLLYFLATVETQNLVQDHAYPSLSLPLIASIKVPIPPLPEQRRIASILDEAFEGIASARANTEKNLQNARNLFALTLNCAIQGRLISQDAGSVSVSDFLSQIEIARRVAIAEGRSKARKLDPLEADNSNRPKLPSGWRWVQLDSLTIGISDGVHKTPRYVAEGIPFVTVRNLTVGRGISFETLSYITREDHQEYIKRTNPERGDILITKDGTIGVVRLIETDVEFSIFVSVALIKPALRELGPYLAYALRAKDVQSQIVPQGAALKHLYIIDLRRLQVPLPPPQMQSLIVDRLDELDVETQRLADIYKGKMAALDELKKALLHQAFTGALTAKAADRQVADVV